MKKIYSIAAGLTLAALVTPGQKASAQMTMTADFKPGPTISQDVNILTTYGCTPTNWPGPGEGLNFLGLTEEAMFEWTIYAGGCGQMTGKTLIRFDQLCTIPPTAIIDYAELRLYGVPSSISMPQGNSWYPPGNPAPYLSNEGWVECVDPTAAIWYKNTVTYNSQPPIITTPAPVTPVAIPVTTTQWNNNLAMDVTNMTQYMLNNGNNGYKIELQNTNIYRCTVWASSDNTTNSLWPELFIKYHLPCNANFGDCNSTDAPNTYTFTADDGTYSYTYTWNFGDGSAPVTGTTATHTYTAIGTYKVCLTLSEQGQVICQECIAICVNSIIKPCIQAKHSNSSTTIHAPIDKLVLDGPLTITSISPNPTSSRLDINFKTLGASEVKYKVYDLTGKEMLHGNTIVSNGAQKLSISVEKLVPGTYLLEMEDGNTRTNAKFTKE